MKFPAWLILIFQCFLILTFELLVPYEFKFASSYLGSPDDFFHFIALIPVLILCGLALPAKWKPFFFASIPAFFIKDLKTLVLLYGGIIAFFTLVRLNKKSTPMTLSLLGIVIGLLICSVNYSPDWILTLIHLSWGLKAIAWIMTVRVYQSDLSRDEFLEYFFHPAFFFFTNDLNVLTPVRFRESSRSVKLTDPVEAKALTLTLMGLFLLFIYGLLQVYFFRKSVFYASFPMIIGGGVISVMTAILFHAANVSLQVSMLRPAGYHLKVDMDKPWLATSTLDYWRRMHYYVRDYVFEIIMKPILTIVLRRDIHVRYFRLIAVIFLYLLFTLTQIGYHPFRTERNLTINAIINLIFIVMILLPEFLKVRHIKIPVSLSRLLTFLILMAGYSVIFSLRKGF